MARLASIFVIALLAFNACGYFIVHGVLLWCNDARVEAMRDADGGSAPLTRLEIPGGRTNAAVRWNTTDECVVDGRLYDIVREEMRGDTLIAFCAHDADEEAIDARLAAHVSRSTGDAASHALRTLLELPSPEGTPVSVRVPGSPVAAARIFRSVVPLSHSFGTAPLSPPPRG